MNASLPTPIPIADFYTNTDTAWGYQVSPDGKRLLWLTLENGRSTVKFRRLDDNRAKTIRSQIPVRWAYWASDSRLIALWGDERGDENYRLLVADSQKPNKHAKRVIGSEGMRVYFHQALRSERPTYLLRHNRRDRAFLDLVRVDLHTGRETTVSTNPGDVETWLTTDAGAPIARIRRRGDYSWSFEHKTDEGWRPVFSGSPEERLAPQGHPPVDSEFIWALSNRGRDRMALVKLDLKSGRETVVYAHDRVDVESVWIDEHDYQPKLASMWPERQVVHFFDAGLQEDQTHFVSLGAHSIRYTSESRDGRWVTVVVQTDRMSRIHYLIDRQRKRVKILSRAPISHHAKSLAFMQGFSHFARDGTPLHGYITLPRGAKISKLPTVLVVHGGPFARDKWGFKPLDQWLANRGYAVVRVNFRGSTGYGRRFVEAAKGEFARKMHTDLIDTIDWLVAKGITDPSAVAIQGTSYGGYAALVGLTQTPTYFAAGISIVGPADLRLLLDTGPAYWRLHKANWFRFIGDPRRKADRIEMARRSPINFVDRIERPLLVVQGGRDVRVIPEHAEKIVTAMRARSLEVEYLLFEDEGHTFRKLETKLQVAKRTERFLHRHLGGRVCH